jgi:hypothetical protein
MRHVVAFSCAHFLARSSWRPEKLWGKYAQQPIGRAGLSSLVCQRCQLPRNLRRKNSHVSPEWVSRHGMVVDASSPGECGAHRIGRCSRRPRHGVGKDASSDLMQFHPGVAFHNATDAVEHGVTQLRSSAHDAMGHLPRWRRRQRTTGEARGLDDTTTVVNTEWPIQLRCTAGVSAGLTFYFWYLRHRDPRDTRMTDVLVAVGMGVAAMNLLVRPATIEPFPYLVLLCASLPFCIRAGIRRRATPYGVSLTFAIALIWAAVAATPPALVAAAPRLHIPRHIHQSTVVASGPDAH